MNKKDIVIFILCALQIVAAGVFYQTHQQSYWERKQLRAADALSQKERDLMRMKVTEMEKEILPLLREMRRDIKAWRSQ